MLRIHPTQVELFARDKLEALAEEAVAMIGRLWPSVARELEPAPLRERVLRALGEGRELGLCTREELLRYLNVTLALGADFAEPGAGGAAQAEAREVLRAGYTSRRKLDLLTEVAERELRRRAY